MTTPLKGIADSTGLLKRIVREHPGINEKAPAGLFVTHLPRVLTLQIRLPALTPMVDVANALTQLATAVNGCWRWDPASGAFVVEGRP